MAEHIIDSLIVRFGLDVKGFKDGEREVEDGAKRIKSESKKTFDAMEQSGKKTGEAIKGVSREVIGLGLAFLGARSITGFLANLATGAASADRFGQTIGMSVKQIWAWRQAMQSVGGQQGDADTALQTIQNARIGFRTGALGPDQAAAFGRLGITGNDLQTKDAGGILSKLAGSKLGKTDPQLYASLLQQVGLPQSTIYFLQQGKDSVDKLLKQYEVNSKDAEKAAKQSEQLQAEMAELNNQLQKALLPVLNQIVPLLTSLVQLMGGTVPNSGASGGTGSGKPGGWSWGIPGLFEFHGEGSTKGNGKTRADRNNNPGNIQDGAFARRQPGYAGGDGRFARFASPDHGFAAMEALLAGPGYMGSGRNTIWSILSKYAPASENNTAAYAAHVSKLTGIGANQPLTRSQLAAVARAMAVQEGYSGGRARYGSLMGAHKSFARHSMASSRISIGQITIHTKATDARGLARDLNANLYRRFAVAQSDPIVNP
jgi:hypothetical protein